jgi:hypothetical protein
VHALLDPGGIELELEGTVVWTRTEQVGGRAAYRGGIEFEAPDRPALARFCQDYCNNGKQPAPGGRQ